MLVAQCPCGARYRIPDGSEGRKIRCKKCHQVFRAPERDDGPIPLAPEGAWEALAREEEDAPARTASGSMFEATGASTAYEPETAPHVDHLPRIRPRTGFWRDVGWSLLFFATPHNLIMFIMVWALYFVAMLAGFVPLVGWFVYLLVLMFIISWYVSIIAETASGEDELPKFSVTAGLFDDVVVPALQYVGTWVVLLLPAILYSSFTVGGLNSLMVVVQLLANPYELVASSGQDPVLVVLVALALFLWPMALMCASMGGLSSLVRIDLIAVSIVRTFLPYVAICVLVTASSILPEIITAAYTASKVGTVTGLASLGKAFFAIKLVAFGVETYFTIVLMRLIGLYYRHFKERFAWDWE